MPQIPFDNLNVLLVGAILFLAAIFAVSRGQRRLESRSPPPGALAPDRKNGPGIDPAIRDDLSDILLRLEETSRRVNGQLDTRFSLLNRLLAEADLKINLLKALAEKGAASGAHGNPAADLAADPQVAEIYRHADAGLEAAEIARKVSRQRGEVELILSLRKFSA